MARARWRFGLVPAIVAVALVGCGGSSDITPSAAATATGTPAAGTPEVTPSPTPAPSGGTPRPTLGAPGAYDAMASYAGAVAAGRYEEAWAMLGPGCQARWGSLAAYTKDRAARMKTGGSEYDLRINPNTLPLASWLVGVGWALEIDQPNAYLLSLRWAGFGQDPRGTEIWIANPALDGWNLYLVN